MTKNLKITQSQSLLIGQLSLNLDNMLMWISATKKFYDWIVYSITVYIYNEVRVKNDFFLSLTLKEKGCHPLKNSNQFLACSN